MALSREFPGSNELHALALLYPGYAAILDICCMWLRSALRSELLSRPTLGCGSGVTTGRVTEQELLTRKRIKNSTSCAHTDANGQRTISYNLGCHWIAGAVLPADMAGELPLPAAIATWDTSSMQDRQTLAQFISVITKRFAAKTDKDKSKLIISLCLDCSSLSKFLVVCKPSVFCLLLSQDSRFGLAHFIPTSLSTKYLCAKFKRVSTLPTGPRSHGVCHQQLLRASSSLSHLI